MRRSFTHGFLAGIVGFLVCWLPLHGGAMPLEDPIPGNIPTGPFVLKLADIIPPIDFATDAEMPVDGSGRIFVALREGKVVIVDGGAALGTPFLDISATTVANAGSAMSAIAFHPEFAVAGAAGEGLLYTVSQAAAGSGVAHFSGTEPTAAHQSVIYEWRVDAADANLADVTTRREILRIDEDVIVHNVNDMAFGPDGYLYIARGDDDMRDTEILDGTTIFGAVLRIDVDDTSGNGRYSIPPDNPFVGNSDGKLEEVYAYGFRNIWRMSFDRQTGTLYVADNGEDQIEEINVVQPGNYYGWIQKEGTFVFLGFPNPSDVSDDLSLLPPDFDGVDPLAQYDHSEGDRSIIGGFVYRGSRVPSLVGHYIFGDWVSGRLFNLDPNTLEIQEITIDPSGDPGGNFIGFGETPDGELLILTADFNSTPASRLIELVSGVAPGLDSDGDGIPDTIETTTLDSDGDGTPDYLDTDSDNNGIPDVIEAADPGSPIDSDDDGDFDFRDPDNDNDGVSDAVEIGGDPANPLDLDNDGIADYVDSDTLGIGDVNTDGSLTVADSLFLQQALIGQLGLSPAQQLQADVYPAGGGDGILNVSDLLVLQTILTRP